LGDTFQISATMTDNDLLDMAVSKRPLCTTMKTYGTKPRPFKLTEDGEDYMIGSEVGNYLRMFRGALYKKYPSMWRRNISQEERKKMMEMGVGYTNLSTNVQIVKASEVEEILAGEEDRFRVQSAGTDHVSVMSHPPMERTVSNTLGGYGSSSRKKNTWTSQIPNSSFHLDAVPCATPLPRQRAAPKRVKTFPSM